jgi:SAM-dependent MidA family methyltransferase
MREALYDPTEGYYCRSDQTRWGRKGDYRTSPDRSSLFAATFARYFARLYDDLGRPAQWTIVESGAGDGHFAHGVLQTLLKSFPRVFAATSYVIDELSQHSRSLARQRLEPFIDRVKFMELGDVEIDPGIVFSNELVDAFPVHRVTRNGTRLQEFYVTVGDSGNFEWLLDGPTGDLSPQLAKYFSEFGIELGEGQIAEVNPGIEGWLRKIADKQCRGYVVTVDYGASADDLYSTTTRQSGTLRGFHRHKFVDDLLARPGEQDLTTTVNWSLVMSVGGRLGFEVVEFTRQDQFLLAAGFLEQLTVESEQCGDESERLRLSTAAREMILPDSMASHFQVLVQKKLEMGGAAKVMT